MMTFHLDQYDTNWKHIHMPCMACVKLPLYLDGIDASIDTQILKTPHIILSHLEYLYIGRKKYIGTLKKEREEIFSEFFTKSFERKFLRYVNEVLFEMIKNSLKGSIFGRNNSHGT